MARFSAFCTHDRDHTDSDETLTHTYTNEADSKLAYEKVKFAGVQRASARGKRSWNAGNDLDDDVVVIVMFAYTTSPSRRRRRRKVKRNKILCRAGELIYVYRFRKVV